MMKNLTSRQKILFGVYAMILAMLGDYLLGFGTFSFSDWPMWCRTGGTRSLLSSASSAQRYLLWRQQS